MKIREKTCNKVVIIGARTSPRNERPNKVDYTCRRVNEFQHRERLNVSYKIGSFIEMARTHNFVDLEETKGNIEPGERGDGIVIGEVRFTPC